jgi:1,4-dihydroxy-2-naphthoate octaprenyltransferase
MFAFRNMIRIARPVRLLLILILYSLGAGIAHYLGRPTNWGSLLLGFLVAVSLGASSEWLVAVFRLPLLPLEKDETPRQRIATRTTLLQLAFGFLTVAAACIVAMMLLKDLSVSAAFVFITMALLYLFYAVPPVRLSASGYGELVEAILIGSLVPVWAFLLQYGAFHRMLTFVTFPLTLLTLAYLLAEDFPAFGMDQKYGNRTLLVRLSWQYAVPVHHMVVSAAYFLLALSPLLGFPWRLDWPVFFSLPFAILQIFWLQRIAAGGRTLWKFFVPLTLATAALAAYLLSFAFWMG